MTVRGAPAIAIVAALSLAVELHSLPQKSSSSPSEISEHITKQLHYLEGSRPTAVNLFEATAKLRGLVNTKLAENASPDAIVDFYIAAAERMLIDDVNDNKAIGDHGANWL